MGHRPVLQHEFEQDGDDEFLDEEDVERFLETRRIVAVLAYLRGGMAHLPLIDSHKICLFGSFRKNFRTIK